tara:strand:- start:358 stop:591 length:234 start_codon:yes stop_codon:yes gene_type:complete
MKKKTFLNNKQIILSSFFSHQNLVDHLFDDFFIKKIINCAELIKKTLNKKKQFFGVEMAEAPQIHNIFQLKWLVDIN